jgi:hypothetical protein
MKSDIVRSIDPFKAMGVDKVPRKRIKDPIYMSVI